MNVRTYNFFYYCMEDRCLELLLRKLNFDNKSDLEYQDEMREDPIDLVHKYKKLHKEFDDFRKQYTELQVQNEKLNKKQLQLDTTIQSATKLLLKSNMECEICFNKIVDRLILRDHCGMHVFCSECASRYKKCIICKTQNFDEREFKQ
jgi:hypothetical protein